VYWAAVLRRLEGLLQVEEDVVFWWFLCSVSLSRPTTLHISSFLCCPGAILSYNMSQWEYIIIINHEPFLNCCLWKLALLENLFQYQGSSFVILLCIL